MLVISYGSVLHQVFERIEVMETGLLRTGVGVRGGHGGQLDRNKDYNRVTPSQEIPSDLLELSMPSTRVVRIIPDISKSHSSNSILNQSSGQVGASFTSAKPNTGVSQDKPRANTTNPGTANSSGIRNLQFGASTTTADSRRVPMNDTSNTRNSSNRSSSNSNSNINSADNYNHNNFVNMYSPKPQEAKSKQAAPNTPLFIRSLGRSLIGGCFETYEPDFALQAVPERDFLPMFCRDLLLTVKVIAYGL
ncbi:hypothetical protein SARC_05595 [Sphaeroforma arctica JP610]|uniref:Uncharacterized protein n=1 Tax=Sphaeroforma arctica JP610 TaxID=667725 RepID=A0A0L0FZW9_9EUKA|nr:hypothetical protein SARC_05595 [Sphaeroforma arctica JP610]KNC82106.1 hypothetical protein SARC_05595 [Sphaeroforma arctica JP610]|eukprot:XP_014156008.1 hypothetical protein SARC_05595 [Sphaeroforma arctica JP610]